MARLLGFAPIFTLALRGRAFAATYVVDRTESVVGTSPRLT
jgi:hypothetical protein